MSLIEILNEIESLAPEERWKVLEHTRQLIDPEIPAEFKEGMEAIAKGETLDLDEAIPDCVPSDLPISGCQAVSSRSW